MAGGRSGPAPSPLDEEVRKVHYGRSRRQISCSCDTAPEGSLGRTENMSLSLVESVGLIGAGVLPVRTAICTRASPGQLLDQRLFIHVFLLQAGDGRARRKQPQHTGPRNRPDPALVSGSRGGGSTSAQPEGTPPAMPGVARIQVRLKIAVHGMERPVRSSCPPTGDVR